MATAAKRLRKARKTRSLIAAVFRALDNGQVTVRELLEAPPTCLERIRVYDVMRRVPHMGNDGAEKLLRVSKVWPLTPFGKLTDEERDSLYRNLPPRAR